MRILKGRVEVIDNSRYKIFPDNGCAINNQCVGIDRFVPLDEKKYLIDGKFVLKCCYFEEADWSKGEDNAEIKCNWYGTRG